MMGIVRGVVRYNIGPVLRGAQNIKLDKLTSLTRLRVPAVSLQLRTVQNTFIFTNGRSRSSQPSLELNSGLRFTRSIHTACGSCLRAAPRNQDEDYSSPVKYSTSKAAKYSSPQTFLNPGRLRAPWYQGYSVLASTAVFLIYFLYLREENDWDEELKNTIYTRIKGLDEATTKQAIEHAQKMGTDSSELRAHLESLDKEKKR